MTDSTTSSTPAMSTGSTDTSVSTPVTSAPETSATSNTSDTRPFSSFGEALRAQGVTDTPDPDVPADPTPAPATAEPADTSVVDPAASTAQKGPIPFDRHEAILKNAREKAAQDVVQRMQGEYGPAIQLQQRLSSDPIGTLTQLIDEAVQHPEIGQHIVSQLARTLGARRKQQPDLTPIDTEVGQVYTAEQVQALVAQQVAERVAPLEQDRQTRVAEQVAARERQQTVQTVTTRLSEWRKQPGFAEHEADIQTHQKAYVESGMDPWSALGLAYAKVVQEKVVPKVQADTTNQFRQTAAQKVAASSSDPNRVAPILSARPKSFREALQQAGL